MYKILLTKENDKIYFVLVCLLLMKFIKKCSILDYEKYIKTSAFFNEI